MYVSPFLSQTTPEPHEKGSPRKNPTKNSQLQNPLFFIYLFEVPHFPPRWFDRKSRQRAKKTFAQIRGFHWFFHAFSARFASLSVRYSAIITFEHPWPPPYILLVETWAIQHPVQCLVVVITRGGGFSVRKGNSLPSKSDGRKYSSWLSLLRVKSFRFRWV